MIIMFINKNSLQVKISGGNYVNLGDYILDAEYSYNKLWSSDSGRNLAGKLSGTLIGIFHKIRVQFRKLNKTEMETIVPILDASRQTIKYYDPKKKTNVEMATYTGDWKVINKHIIDSNGKNEGFQISFISVAKRS